MTNQQKKPGESLPNDPEKYIPVKPDKNPDVTEPQPEKVYPTRIMEPEKIDPTRIPPPLK